MSEDRIHTARRLGYRTVAEAEANHWRNLTKDQRSALAEHRKQVEEVERAAARQKRAHEEDLKRRGMQEIEIPGALIKRGQLGGHGWIVLGMLHMERSFVRGLP